MITEFRNGIKGIKKKIENYASTKKRNFKNKKINEKKTLNFLSKTVKCLL
jgi:uncharacterized protein YkvS